MKRLILNVLALALLLVVLSAIAGNTSSAVNLTDDQISHVSEDPNQPEPESAFNDNHVSYLGEEDPDEPEPESTLIDYPIG